METTYKDVQITYDEEQDIWKAQVQGARIIKQSLKQIRKAIDYQKKKAFKRIPVWVTPGGWKHKRYQKGEITSVFDDGYDTKAWVSFDKNEREQVTQKELVEDSPKNTGLIKLIHVFMDDIKDLQKKKDELESQLDPIADLIKEDVDEQDTERE